MLKQLTDHLLVKLKKLSLLRLLRSALLLLGLYILQAEVFPWFLSDGIPLLPAVAAAAVAHTRGSFPGCLFGLFAGILLDSALGQPTLMFTLLLPIGCLLLGYASEVLLTRNFLGYLFTCGVCVLGCSFFQMLSPLVFRGAALLPLLMTALLQLLTSLVAAACLYPLFRSRSDFSGQKGYTL